MSAIISIPARMASSRFPSKVLADLNGVPSLAFLINRLKTAAPCVVVTGSDAEDDPIVSVAREAGAEVVRGQHGDMIAQHYRVAEAFPADVYLMAGADDPLLDPRMFAFMIRLMDGFDAAYGASEGFPLGLNVWAWTYRAIAEADFYAEAADERQHVIPFWERRPRIYPKVGLRRPGADLYDAFRVTVDEGPDMQLVRIIASALPDGFGAEDVIDLMARHPELNLINPGGLRGYAARDALYDLTPIRDLVPA